MDCGPNLEFPPLVQAHRTPLSLLISDSALQVSLGRPLPTLSQPTGNQSKFNWRADRTVLTMGFPVFVATQCPKRTEFLRSTAGRKTGLPGVGAAHGCRWTVRCWFERRPGSWSRCWCRSCQTSKWPCALQGRVTTATSVGVRMFWCFVYAKATIKPRLSQRPETRG